MKDRDLKQDQEQTRIDDSPTIDVGRISILAIPSEDLGLEDDGADLNFSSKFPQLRRPAKHEWIAFDPEKGMTVRLLAIPRGMAEDYYFVDPEVRSLVADELQGFLIQPYYSVPLKVWNLWPVRADNPSSTWYRSIASLRGLDAGLYKTEVFRVRADRDNGRYACKARKADPGEIPAWPGRDVGEMLAEALGGNIVKHAEHPAIAQLVQSRVLV